MAFHTTTPVTSNEVTLVPVSVKNTFIDGFYEEELSQTVVPFRRSCSSLPPKFRLFHEEGFHGLSERQDVPCIAPVPFPRATGVAVQKSSTEEEDASTEVATSESEDASSRSEVGVSEMGDTSKEVEAASLDNKSHPLQSPLVQKTCLNPRAKAWNPDEASRSWQATMPTHCTDQTNSIASFGLQLATVMAATRMALLNCAHVIRVESRETPGAWSIGLRIPAKDGRFKEAALTVAKQALLNAAAKSQHVYVCGYRHRPFVMTPTGFIATLGCVSDETTACWGLIQQGFCKFGPRCQWKHPEMQTTVTVTVVLEDITQQ